MKRFGLVGWILLGLLPWVMPALADTPLGGNTSALATAFNAQAEKMDLDQRIALSKCDPGKIEVCSYSGGSDIKIAAMSVESGSDLNSLIVVFGSENPEALHLIGTLGTLMGMYAPDAAAAERGVVFSSLLDGLKSDEGKAEASLHGIKFNASAPAGMGLWIFITRP